ncbi:MAG: DEAD/DEAH box helicase [Parcubacteria group bacterium]|nr:DEAD/DEAH box helicase [Parcubacteria group bacterium]
METTHPKKSTSRVLIANITPYFLEKGLVWFEEHEEEMVKAAQGFLAGQLMLCEAKQPYHLSEFLRELDELGYEKVFRLEHPGEFTHLGGQVQVFPINTRNALRFEFLGNTIESVEQLKLAVEDEESVRRLLKKRFKSQKLFSDLKGLKKGDYIVHLDHGVGRFLGICEQIEHTFRLLVKNEHEEGKIRYYALEYAAGDKLFVPAGLERKLSRYVGFTEPAILRLGAASWQKTKGRVREEVERLAKELLALYAKKETAGREPYAAPGELSQKVAVSFPYQETEDQLRAIKDIEKDLQKSHPMDRIVCGDVGFGKTEIALRAMVYASEQGYQSVLLCPTTILAHQHMQTFSERLHGLPLRVEILSRLQNKKEQLETLRNLKRGTIDILIGTHRVLSSDVIFKNLGLLVIDDEQRFGVKQKEKMRQLSSSINILSLSATPIPRTLYMALSSLKHVSLVQEPPRGRMAVRIVRAMRSKKIIQEAIKQEISRKGQVYYLHNRVGTTSQVQQELERIIPGARCVVAHGRLPEKKLVGIMEDFGKKKYDVLVATTIIENGIDLANVNTIIVEDASLLGLSQAYQLKGRVGRSHASSFAYFLHGKRLSPKAKLRLRVLQEAEDLGSGYRIALRDMEIRGAGNLLGREQSGSVNAVGLNLYCQMLSEAVEREKVGEGA